VEQGQEPTDQASVEDVDVDLIDYLLTLTPAERVKRQLDALELVRALRKAGQKHHGFDPGSPAASR
jgi:hypothetical protein